MSSSLSQSDDHLEPITVRETLHGIPPVESLPVAEGAGGVTTAKSFVLGPTNCECE